VTALEELVRDNELLRTKVAHLELLVFGPEGVEDDEAEAETRAEDEAEDDWFSAADAFCSAEDSDDDDDDDGDLFGMN
jgi:hypothetical protein